MWLGGLAFSRVIVQIGQVRPGISPKDFAAAIGVSESSVKRWVDQGALIAARTAGGHRRIAREEALRWVREQRARIVRPDKLGLEPGTLELTRASPLQTAAEHLYLAFVEGRGDDAREVMVGLFVAGHGVAAIADEVIRPAMERIGKLWEHGPNGIFVEHRATDLCLRAIEELRGLLRDGARSPEVARPIALVAGGERDPYVVAPLLAAVTLAELGLEVHNLGPDTPLSVIELASRELGASLVVLSLSALPEPHLQRELVAFVEAAQRDARLVAIGGQAVDALELKPRPNLFIGRTLSELAAFARGALAS